MESEIQNDINNNNEFNVPITCEELTRAISRLKLNKTVGFDKIPNEVLKQHSIKRLLHKLFSFCFDNGMVPATWLRAIISPIPKGADKDPCVPLNYRGVSLLSCMHKTYSSIINNRLMGYFEDQNILVDEQNGFRAKRACVDHVYSLSTIIRNRLAEGKSTFAAFVDMQKAFDWVDRELLLYKLYAMM
jgi:hypothetical protein